MKSRVSEKGQVTIPKPLRISLGIVEGTDLEFEEKGGALVARPVTRQDPIDALRARRLQAHALAPPPGFS